MLHLFLFFNNENSKKPICKSDYKNSFDDKNIYLSQVAYFLEFFKSIFF